MTKNVKYRSGPRRVPGFSTARALFPEMYLVEIRRYNGRVLNTYTVGARLAVPLQLGCASPARERDISSVDVSKERS